MLRILLCMLCIAAAVAGYAEDRALLIGVGDYKGDSADLPGIDTDVELMEETARALGFKAGQIEKLMDREATLNNVRAAFKGWLKEDVRADDRVLIYFSGHGTRIYDDNDDEADGLDETLMLYDFNLVPPYRDVLIDDEFGQLLAGLRSRNVLVFIDACHSGSATKSMRGLGDDDASAKVLNDDGNTAKFFAYEGMPMPTSGKSAAKDSRGFGVEAGDMVEGRYAALSAAQDDEVARASPRGSYFTLGVHDAVKKASKDSGELTLEQVYQHAGKYIEKIAGDPSKIHHPQLDGDRSMWKENLLQRGGGGDVGDDVGGAWVMLERVEERASGSVPFTVNSARFSEGRRDLLELEVKTSRSGYLHVLNVDPLDESVTVLFPNGFNKDNWVEQGDAISIPPRGANSFKLPAQKPLGKTMVFVLLSNENMAMDALGKKSGPLSVIKPGALARFLHAKGFGVEGDNEQGYYASKRIVEITP